MDDEEEDKKVVPLRKGFVSVVKDKEPVDQADPKIVKYLEMLLEDAKSGDIKAIAIVALKEPDMMKCWYRCKSPFSNALLGAAQRLVGHILTDLNKEEI